MITFDIETKPHFDKEYVDSFKKPFDPADVAIGNTKDPVKIEEKIEKSRLSHDDNFYKDALLKAELSQVFALTILKPQDLELKYTMSPRHSAKMEVDGIPVEIFVWINDEEGDVMESQIVSEFFGLYRQINELHFSHGQTDEVMVGHNNFGFDLPYLKRKGWQYRVKIPADFFVGRSYNPVLQDCSSIWGEGVFSKEQKIGQYISLDKLSKFLGTGEKADKIAEFVYAIYPDDKKRALQYMANDVILPFKNYKIMRGI